MSRAIAKQCTMRVVTWIRALARLRAVARFRRIGFAAIVERGEAAGRIEAVRLEEIEEARRLLEQPCAVIGKRVPRCREE